MAAQQCIPVVSCVGVGASVCVCVCIVSLHGCDNCDWCPTPLQNDDSILSQLEYTHTVSVSGPLPSISLM